MRENQIARPSDIQPRREPIGRETTIPLLASQTVQVKNPDPVTRSEPVSPEIVLNTFFISLFTVVYISVKWPLLPYGYFGP